jgi:hypothetical protein
MPSVPHEMLVELLAKSPQLLPPLLGDRLDAASRLHAIPDLRSSDLRIRTSQSTASQLPVLFADLGLELYRPSSVHPYDPCLALTVEAQLTLDEDKPYSWIPYLGAQYHLTHAPAYLLVVTNDPSIAAWAAGPFCAGHLTLTPWVLGPADVPAIITLEEARKSIDMTLFSGIVHGREGVAVPIGLALRQVLDEAPDDVGIYYWDAFLASLTKPVRKELDMELHDFRPRSDWSKEIFAKGLAEGEAKGAAKARAKDLLSLLEGRRFALDAKLRRRIAQCTDLVKLESWFHKAITAKSIEAIFVEPAPRHVGKAAVRRSRSRARLLSGA